MGIDPRPKLLIIDDDATLSASMERALRDDWQVTTASDVTSGRQLFDNGPNIVLLDIRLDNSERNAGVDLLQGFHERSPDIPIVMISAYGDIETAVECMRTGAVDFLKKPVDLKELRQRLNRALEQARVSRRVAHLEERLEQIEPTAWIGETVGMLDARRLIQMVAQDGYATVLITGETGTGKELVAREIHRTGWRVSEPFVPVAISSLNESIVESELFGHEAGAFTDAKQQRLGFLEKARGGVLFLDEIGELPEQAQLKLLRFLEDRSFARAGSTHEIKLDVQIVAATNRDLDQGMAEGRIRKDFYFRLKSVQIRLPPLRDRREDIPALARHFLRVFYQQGRTRATEVESSALAALMKYEWPGNVRELRAALERAVIYANHLRHNSIKREHLPLEVLQSPEVKSMKSTQLTLGGDVVDLERELARAELSYIEMALKASNETKSEATRLLGLHDRFTLRRRITAITSKFPDLTSDYPTVRKLYSKSNSD